MCNLEKEAGVGLSRAYLNLMHTLMETISVTMKIDETDLSRGVIMECARNLYSASEALYLKLHEMYVLSQEEGDRHE